MQSSKLITLVCCLDENEFKALGRFIHSPYFNTKTKVSELYEYISKSYPGFQNRRIAKKAAWLKLFPGKTFRPKKMNDLMSELTVIVQKFMAVHSICNEERAFRLTTALAMSKKNLFTFFLEELKKVKTAIVETKERSATNLLFYFLLTKENYYHPLSPKIPPAGQLLIEANTYLEHFFVASKLKLILESKLRKRIFSEESELDLDLLEKMIAVNDYRDPLIKVYYKLLIAQRNKNLDLLSEIEENLTSWLPLLAKEDRIIVIHALINQVSLIYHSGNPGLVKMLIQLFKHGLDERIFLTSGNIRHTTFLNISVTAAAAGDFRFLDEFIENYQEYLSEKTKEDTVCLAEAYRFFHKGTYDEAISKLADLSRSRMPEYEFRLRNLEVRCFFEKSSADPTYWELFFARNHSFEKYLWRNEILSESRMEGYKNFVRITKKIATAINANKLNTRKKTSLLTELEECNNIVSFNWIKAKIMGDEDLAPSPEGI